MKSVNVMRCKLVKESEINYQSISCASEAVSILKELMQDVAEEYFWILCLDVKGNVIGCHEISHGDLSSAPVHPREIFKRAVLNNSASIICGHNHPSGDPTPSMEDIALTSRIAEAGKLMGIRMLDHIIIGDENYHSFAGTGMLES